MKHKSATRHKQHRNPSYQNRCKSPHPSKGNQVIKHKLCDMIHSFFEQWGSATQALAAIATCISLIWTFQAYNHTLYEDSQANKVSAWLSLKAPDNDPYRDGQRQWVNIRNSSTQSVYNVVISSGVIFGAGDASGKGREHASVIATLPPGEYQVDIPHLDFGMSKEFAAVISFTDTTGQSWVRDANGKLSKIKQNPYEYMETGLPPELTTPIPVHDA
ncbi:hypothetical protein [Bifidobacterium sp.]|uniref:hypothetical protein n=1 Tax=Bifidobacterium sp. TaxID=41200 RepID=UPI003D7E202E